MATRYHYVPNLREEVRSLLKAELRELEIRLHELERQSQVQAEVINILAALALRPPGDGDAIREYLETMPNPYSEFDIRYAYLEQAKERIKDLLESNRPEPQEAGAESTGPHLTLPEDGPPK